MKRAAIYIRVSSEKQAERVSPQAQEDDARALCGRKGYHVVETYRDIEKYRVGKRLVEPSGTRNDRPQFRRMLADARAQQFDLVIAWREDRLYRGLRPMLDFLECLDETGIDCELVKETFDKKIAPVKAWAARMELDAKHDRFMMGIAGKLSRGGNMFFNPPYGYRYNTATGKYEIHEPEAAFVRLMFRWRSEGQPLLEIRRRLIAQNAPTRRAKKRTWSLVDISKRLHYAPYHTGLTPINWDGQIYQVTLPPIVSPDLAATVTGMGEGFKVWPSSDLRSQALAPGLVYCLACGTQMGVCLIRRGEKQYLYYTCRYRSQMGETRDGCARNIPVHKADAEIWGKVQAFLEQPSLLDIVTQETVENLEAPAGDLAAEARRLQAALDELPAERQRIITWGRKEIITEADMQAQLFALAEQDADLRRSLSDNQFRQAYNVENRAKLAEAYRAEIQAGWEAVRLLDLTDPEQAAAQFQARKVIIAALVHRVDVLPDKTSRVRIVLDIPPDFTQSFLSSL